MTAGIAEQYRQFALECARRAVAARDQRVRRMLLETSRQWMTAAQKVEWSSADQTPEKPEIH